jgi:hypothetical protein
MRKASVFVKERFGAKRGKSEAEVGYSVCL